MAVIQAEGWRARGLEGQRAGGSEGWRVRGLEGQRAGGSEGWRVRGLEGWRVRGLRVDLIQSSMKDAYFGYSSFTFSISLSSWDDFVSPTNARSFSIRPKLSPMPIFSSEHI